MGFAYSVHRPAWKDNEVAELRDNITGHSVFAVVSIQGIPARQFQKIRAELRGVAKLKVARNTLIDLAFKEISADAAKLFKNVNGQTALVFTNENPFKLFQLLEKSKTPAPAKGGDIAPQDIVIERGPTNFRPGPIVGELQNVGIPAAIEKGKVIIRENKVIVKRGEKISPRIADVLQRLEINPMEVGLYLRAAYDGTTIYTPKDLAIDVPAYLDQFMQAVSTAFQLAMDIEYPTEMTVIPLLQKGLLEARGLAVKAEIFEPEVMDALLLKSHNEALVIVMLLPDKALDKELKVLKGQSGTVAVSAAEPQKAQEKIEVKEEKEKEPDFSGLGALFE
jgi:large subunit ribosomal protein L10